MFWCIVSHTFFFLTFKKEPQIKSEIISQKLSGFFFPWKENKVLFPRLWQRKLKNELSDSKQNIAVKYQSHHLHPWNCCNKPQHFWILVVLKGERKCAQVSDTNKIVLTGSILGGWKYADEIKLTRYLEWKRKVHFLVSLLREKAQLWNSRWLWVYGHPSKLSLLFLRVLENDLRMLHIRRIHESLW